jgi:hypothetical protein
MTAPAEFGTSSPKAVAQLPYCPVLDIQQNQLYLRSVSLYVRKLTIYIRQGASTSSTNCSGVTRVLASMQQQHFVSGGLCCQKAFEFDFAWQMTMYMLGVLPAGACMLQGDYWWPEVLHTCKEHYVSTRSCCQHSHVIAACIDATTSSLTRTPANSSARGHP